MSPSALETAIGQIYAAATGHASWAGALIGAAELCGFENAALVMVNPAIGLAEVHTPRADPAVVAAYGTTWWAKDPTIDPNRSAAIGAITSLDTMGRDAFLRSEFHNDFWRHSGLGVERMTANLLGDGTAFASVVMQASARNDVIEGDQAARFARLVPHLVQSAAIMSRLARLQMANAAQSAVIARKADFALVVDGALRPCDSAPHDDAILRAPEPFVRRGRALGLRAPRLNARLADLVAGCSGAGPLGGTGLRGGSLAIPDEDGAARHVIDVVPWGGDPATDPVGLGPRPAAMLIVTDRQARFAQVEDRLRTLYALTAAELRVALALVQGGGRSGVAERLGISETTARSHLSRLFDKTGTTRQAELVALIVQEMR